MYLSVYVFYTDTATTEIYTYSHTLSLHDALPISVVRPGRRAAVVPARTARTTRRWRGRAVRRWSERSLRRLHGSGVGRTAVAVADRCLRLDRKSTRLNSSH